MTRAVRTLLAGAALALLAGQAGAQSRQFDCSDGSALTLKVLNATMIAAGPINGRTVAMRQTAQPMHYAYGDFELDIARDQKRITLTGPGGETLDCAWSGASAGGGAPPAGAQARTEPPGAPARSREPASRPGRQSPGNAGASAAAPGGFPAKSWGGVVRAGPGMEHDRLASLQEGAKIALLEKTGVEMNGYPWFKIRYQGNKIGYQWGGIICPVGRLVAGTFEQCD